jgi:hypothetical protein
LGKEDNKKPLSLRCKRAQKEKVGPSILGNGVLAEKGSYKALSHEVRQREGNEEAACSMERELTLSTYAVVLGTNKKTRHREDRKEFAKQVCEKSEDSHRTDTKRTP